MSMFWYLIYLSIETTHSILFKDANGVRCALMDLTDHTLLMGRSRWVFTECLDSLDYYHSQWEDSQE